MKLMTEVTGFFKLSPPIKNAAAPGGVQRNDLNDSAWLISIGPS
jgi:hypothetical protein